MYGSGLECKAVLEVYMGYLRITENHMEKAWNVDWKLGKYRLLHDLGYLVQGAHYRNNLKPCTPSPV